MKSRPRKAIQPKLENIIAISALSMGSFQPSEPHTKANSKSAATIATRSAQII